LIDLPHITLLKLFRYTIPNSILSFLPTQRTTHDPRPTIRDRVESSRVVWCRRRPSFLPSSFPFLIRFHPSFSFHYRSHSSPPDHSHSSHSSYSSPSQSHSRFVASRWIGISRSRHTNHVRLCPLRAMALHRPVNRATVRRCDGATVRRCDGATVRLDDSVALIYHVGMCLTTETRLLSWTSGPRPNSVSERCKHDLRSGIQCDLIMTLSRLSGVASFRQSVSQSRQGAARTRASVWPRWRFATPSAPSPITIHALRLQSFPTQTGQAREER
jgi:hypothetical protein